MIVVADTSPLNYLVLIDEIGILPALFERVVAPETVARELSHERAPDPVPGSRTLLPGSKYMVRKRPIPRLHSMLVSGMLSASLWS